MKSLVESLNESLINEGLLSILRSLWSKIKDRIDKNKKRVI